MQKFSQRTIYVFIVFLAFTHWKCRRKAEPSSSQSPYTTVPEDWDPSEDYASPEVTIQELE